MVEERTVKNLRRRRGNGVLGRIDSLTRDQSAAESPEEWERQSRTILRHAGSVEGRSIGFIRLGGVPAVGDEVV